MAASATRPAATSTGTPTIDFTRDIHPILEHSCGGGQSGEPAIVPGYADDSPLIQNVSDKIEDLEMPPLNRRKKYPALSPEELERLHTWIDAGAVWPAAPPAAKESAPAPTASTETTTATTNPGT